MNKSGGTSAKILGEHFEQISLWASSSITSFFDWHKDVSILTDFWCADATEHDSISYVQ